MRAALDLFNKVHQNHERMREVRCDSRESLDNAFMDMEDSMSKFKDCRDLHDLACCDLQFAGARVTEAKRKEDDAQDQVRAHRERCRRVSAEYKTAEEDLNECLGCAGQLIRDIAGATHTLSCDTTDLDSNKVRNQQEASDIIEDFQRRGARREVADIILVERQRWNGRKKEEKNEF